MQTLKGFRDFLPAEKSVRDQVKAKIEASFQRFGFAAIETPTLEYASLLLGKYGKEADKLVQDSLEKIEKQAKSAKADFAIVKKWKNLMIFAF